MDLKALLEDDSPVQALADLTQEIAAVYHNTQEIPQSLRELQGEAKQVSALLVQVSKLLDEDFPKEFKSQIVDIHASIEDIHEHVSAYIQKVRDSTGWLRYLPIIRPVVSGLGPATAMYFALTPHGITILLTLFTIGLLLFWLAPGLLWELADAWHGTDLSRFDRMSADLERHSCQLRRIVTLQSQVSAARRYDVTKNLTESDSKAFWINYFGAEKYSVPTPRFIETLLAHSGPEPATFQDDDQSIVYRTIRRIVDANDDGSVSPAEFEDFLRFFGPLEQCVPKVVGSLIALSKHPDGDAYMAPCMRPWFCWRNFTRADVDAMLPRQGVGAFLMRCSTTRPGQFAISFVAKGEDDSARVRHALILNTNEGYRFDKKTTHYRSLQALVKDFPTILVRPYKDPECRITFNVSGARFECQLGLFAAHPDTLLGRRFHFKDYDFRGVNFDDEVFLDRDPHAFAVILNWYRSKHNSIHCPLTVPLSLLQEEFEFFELPWDPDAVLQTQVQPELVKLRRAATTTTAEELCGRKRHLEDARRSTSDGAVALQATHQYDADTKEAETYGDASYSMFTESDMGCDDPATKSDDTQREYSVGSDSIVDEPSAKTASPVAAPATPSVEEQDELDLDFEHKRCYLKVNRIAALSVLKTQPVGTYIFRPCSDPSELVDGKPNPDLFVLSCLDTSGQMRNIKVFRIAGKGLSENHRSTDASELHSTLDAVARKVVGEAAAAFTGGKLGKYENEESSEPNQSQSSVPD